MIKKTIKNLVYTSLNGLHFLFPRSGFCSILMYHSVGDNGAFFTVKPENFKRQMDYLKRNNYETLFLADMVKKLKAEGGLNPKNVVLTFDDGYEDNFLNTLPVLREHNFKATIFLTTDFIGKEMGSKNNAPLKIMSWEQIFEMHKSGLVDFQPHGAGHIDLTSIPAAEAEEEILKSKELLEERLNKKCNLFAYPWGKYNESVVDILRRRDFEGAMTVQEGIIKENADIFKLNRNSVDSSTTWAQFAGKLNYSVEIFRKIFKSK